MVSGLTAREYEDRLLELGLVTLEERRHQMDMAQVHKMLAGIDKVNTEALFTMAYSHGRHTRNADAPQLAARGVAPGGEEALLYPTCSS